MSETLTKKIIKQLEETDKAIADKRRKTAVRFRGTEVDNDFQEKELHVLEVIDLLAERVTKIKVAVLDALQLLQTKVERNIIRITELEDF